MRAGPRREPPGGAIVARSRPRRGSQVRIGLFPPFFPAMQKAKAVADQDTANRSLEGKQGALSFTAGRLAGYLPAPRFFAGAAG